MAAAAIAAAVIYALSQLPHHTAAARVVGLPIPNPTTDARLTTTTRSEETHLHDAATPVPSRRRSGGAHLGLPGLPCLPFALWRDKPEVAMLSAPPCTCGRDAGTNGAGANARDANAGEEEEQEEEHATHGIEGTQPPRRPGHNTTCDALDAPGTSVILVGLPPNTAAIVAALSRVFDPSADWAPSGVEAIVLVPSSAPDALETEVFAALKKTEGAVSYRNEPFERTSLVRSSTSSGGDVSGDEAADVDAAVRMAAGASVAVWTMGEAEAGEVGAGGRSVPRARLLAAQASRCWRDGSGAAGSGGEEEEEEGVGEKAADDDVKITFIVQYYKRPALISRIVAGLATGTRAALGGRGGGGGGWEVLVANDGGGGDDGAAWAKALKRVSTPRMRWRVVNAGNLHEIRTYARLSRLATVGRYKLNAVVDP